MPTSDSTDTPQSIQTTALSRRTLLKGSALGAAALLVDATVGQTIGLPGAPVEAAELTGPSTTLTPYLVPTAPGVEFTAILTVGDLPADNGYRMVGIPDGLGAFLNGGGRGYDRSNDRRDSDERGRDRDTFTVLMNHELGNAAGIVRAHGSKGAFVSEWRIRRSDLKVLEGRDFTPDAAHVYNWVGGKYVQGTTAWNRFCSADLADPSAYRFRDLGTSQRIYLNGEENNDGRAWAHIATGPNRGQSWELPRLGRLAWENAVASPFPQEKTIVIGLDDGDLSTAATTAAPCEIWVYVGTKTRTGNEIERAGLTNGKLYGMRVTVAGAPLAEEGALTALGGATDTSTGSAGRFSLTLMGPAATPGDVSAWNTGAQLTADSVAKGLFRMRRIEDGAWDPRPGKSRDFYFVTTAITDPAPATTFTPSRLWRLRFDDIENPEAGGTITNLLPNASPQRMMDNICIDGLGRILIQEDLGNSATIGKVWMYIIDTGALIEIAQHNPTLFDPTSPHFMTADEEASGVIDASDILGDGWFLLDVQNHRAIPAPITPAPALDPYGLVQHGQLLAMYVPPRLGRGRGSN